MVDGNSSAPQRPDGSAHDDDRVGDPHADRRPEEPESPQQTGADEEKTAWFDGEDSPKERAQPASGGPGQSGSPAETGAPGTESAEQGAPAPPGPAPDAEPGRPGPGDSDDADAGKTTWVPPSDSEAEGPDRPTPVDRDASTEGHVAGTGAEDQAHTAYDPAAAAQTDRTRIADDADVAEAELRHPQDGQSMPDAGQEPGGPVPADRTQMAPRPKSHTRTYAGADEGEFGDVPLDEVAWPQEPASEQGSPIVKACIGLLIVLCITLGAYYWLEQGQAPPPDKEPDTTTADDRATCEELFAQAREAAQKSDYRRAADLATRVVRLSSDYPAAYALRRDMRRLERAQTVVASAGKLLEQLQQDEKKWAELAPQGQALIAELDDCRSPLSRIEHASATQMTRRILTMRDGLHELVGRKLIVRRADQLFRQGNYSKELQILERVRLEPERCRAIRAYLKGVRLRAEGVAKLDAARQALLQVPKSDCHQPMAQRVLKQVDTDIAFRDQLQEAERQYDRADLHKAQASVGKLTEMDWSLTALHRRYERLRLRLDELLPEYRAIEKAMENGQVFEELRLWGKLRDLEFEVPKPLKDREKERRAVIREKVGPQMARRVTVARTTWVAAQELTEQGGEAVWEIPLEPDKLQTQAKQFSRLADAVCAAWEAAWFVVAAGRLTEHPQVAQYEKQAADIREFVLQKCKGLLARGDIELRAFSKPDRAMLYYQRVLRLPDVPGNTFRGAAAKRLQGLQKK